MNSRKTCEAGMSCALQVSRNILCKSGSIRMRSAAVFAIVSPMDTHNLTLEYKYFIPPAQPVSTGFVVHKCAQKHGKTWIRANNCSLTRFFVLLLYSNKVYILAKNTLLGKSRSYGDSSFNSEISNCHHKSSNHSIPPHSIPYLLIKLLKRFDKKLICI